jgi:hypothetical protein
MLAVSNGRHILMSTPFGKQNHFFKTWDEQQDIWERYEIQTEMCPSITKRFFEDRKGLTPGLNKNIIAGSWRPKTSFSNTTRLLKVERTI